MIGDCLNTLKDVEPKHVEVSWISQMPTLKLTASELVVLRILMGQDKLRSYKLKEIADVLGNSVKTIDVHRQHIYTKLDIHDIVELTHFAIRYNLVPLKTFTAKQKNLIP